MTGSINWIALDWGTTHLRAYALDKENSVLEESFSTKGMGTLSQAEFEPALLELIAGWLPRIGTIEVLACGMVGARQGWLEAPYQSVPCEPDTSNSLVRVLTNDERLEVYILPGVNQGDPSDVMRGEETQIAGFIESQSRQKATICLPGTHSKWVTVVDGSIVTFSTYMTGEMFTLLCEHSVLRFSVDSPDWKDTAYLKGVDASLRDPANFLNSCFRLRAEGLLKGLPAAEARSYLSGLLIGAEISASRPYWANQSVALVGDLKLTKLYADALALVDVEAKLFDPKELTLAGLTRAHQSILGQPGN